jgi:hypothetical protein
MGAGVHDPRRLEQAAINGADRHGPANPYGQPRFGSSHLGGSSAPRDGRQRHRQAQRFYAENQAKVVGAARRASKYATNEA